MYRTCVQGHDSKYTLTLLLISGPDGDDSAAVIQLLGNDTEPETSDKWRRLAMTPVSTEPEVLKLQRCLATAAMEYDILQTKIKKKTIETDLKIEELSAKLLEATTALDGLRNNSDDWHCRYEGTERIRYVP